MLTTNGSSYPRFCLVYCTDTRESCPTLSDLSARARMSYNATLCHRILPCFPCCGRVASHCTPARHATFRSHDVTNRLCCPSRIFLLKRPFWTPTIKHCATLCGMINAATVAPHLRYTRVKLSLRAIPLAHWPSWTLLSQSPFLNPGTGVPSTGWLWRRATTLIASNQINTVLGSRPNSCIIPAMLSLCSACQPQMSELYMFSHVPPRANRSFLSCSYDPSLSHHFTHR